MTILSIAIITSNEAEVLPVTLECILALGPLVKKVVIVDDYSTDETRRNAFYFAERGLPLTFTPHRFENFSQQKNFALKYCSGEWILALDADMAFNAENLRLHFERHFFDEALVWDFKLIYAKGDLRHFDSLSGVGPTTRLFRNDLGLQYRGDVHEHLCFPGETERGDLYKVRGRHLDTANICIIETSQLKSAPALRERAKRYQRWKGELAPSLDDAERVINDRWLGAEPIPDWILLDVPEEAFRYPLAKGFPR